jgi:hypothetical protein
MALLFFAVWDALLLWAAWLGCRYAAQAHPAVAAYTVSTLTPRLCCVAGALASAFRTLLCRLCCTSASCMRTWWEGLRTCPRRGPCSPPSLGARQPPLPVPALAQPASCPPWLLH